LNLFFMKLLKIFFYYIIFFFIFYFETIEIAGIKLALIWKGALIIHIIVTISSQKRKYSNMFIRIGYLWGIKNIFTLSIMQYFMETISLTLKSINLTLCYKYIKSKYNNPEIIAKLIISISIFIIVSSLPFHLGIIKPLVSAYNINNYTSGPIDTSAYVGIFQNPHSTAIITSLAVISLLFFVNKKRILLPIILLGLINTYLTYVRTGYLLLIVGLVITLYFKVKRKVILFAIFPVIFYSLFLITGENDLFVNRLFNITKYSDTHNVTVESLGSGRTYFWITNLYLWVNSDIFTQTIGYGEEIAKDNMQKAIGLRLVSHNGYIDSLIQNGLLGSIIFLLFLFYMLNIVMKNKKSEFFPLALIAFFCYTIMHVVQGGYFFLFDVLIALNIGLVSDENIQNVKK
ncbi:MAG: O-antigen ligase family protein, partial [bacterium]